MPFITTISLVWLIYIFLFTESDKQILDLFNRLKFSLAINNEGAVEKIQLDIKMYMGIPEVISMGKIFKSGDSHKKNIETFKKKTWNIDLFKKLLIVNLFLLTIHPWLNFLNCFFSMQIHIILSLIFGLCFYWYVQQLPSLEFSRIVPISECGSEKARK